MEEIVDMRSQLEDSSDKSGGNHSHIKISNGQIVQSAQEVVVSAPNIRKLPESKQTGNFVDNYASQNSGQTYDTASFYH